VSVGHYENFPVASLLLPQPLREPVSVIYRFARTADDFADEGQDPPETRIAKLQEFHAHLVTISLGQIPQNPLFQDLAKVIRDFQLPITPFRDLLDAFTQDVVKNRYVDFAEVLEYCRRSANPVGRILLHLFHKTDTDNCQHSDRICTALQLINFWQDVDIDCATRNRIYLPQDEMRRFGVTEEQLRERRCDRPFQELMRFQAERARRMMLEGAALVDQLEGRFRLEIAITVQGGLRILEKLERSNYDMFRRRPVLRALDWPLLFLRTF
jgi:squalene synthase HpnC